MIQDVVKVGAKSWKYLLRHNAGKVLYAMTSGYAIYRLVKLIHKTYSEMAELQQEFDASYNAYRKRMDDIMAEVRKIGSLENATDETKKSIEETQHEIEKLLEELDD